MTTVAQNQQLLKNLAELTGAFREEFKQERTYHQVTKLALAELFVLTRHTVTQLLMSLGETEGDWSRWYRVWSQRRFDYDRMSEVLFTETLEHVAPDELYVVAADVTHTPRSSRKLEGSELSRNPHGPHFQPGLRPAQRWSNGCWLIAAEMGWSRALPIRLSPAFTAKSAPKVHEPKTECEAGVDFLVWVREQLVQNQRPGQLVLALGDGAYDSLKMWQELPPETILLARSAKNRALYELPTQRTAGRGRKRLYGERAAAPQAIWAERKGWQKMTLEVRGLSRHLQVKVRGPFLRRGAPHCPLMLIVVRGKGNAKTRRDPLPFLVNARQAEDGTWQLPLPVETLLFWAWQRWELEVCHRELKSNFGLGNKQCFNPYAAVASVQWSAWVYALLLLAGYRTFGLTRAGPVPTAWWRGSPRWSLNTLWRAYRAAFWQTSEFQPLQCPTSDNWAEIPSFMPAMRNAVLAAARS